MTTIFSKANEIVLHTLFDIIPINFCWLDTEGYILGCNYRVLEILKIADVNDIIGKHTSDVVPQIVWDNTKDVIKSGKSSTFEEEYTDKTGKKTYFISIKTPIKADNNKILGVVIIGIDITDRKLMEIELERTKKQAQTADKAKTEFLRHMSHDLRSPFSGIIGGAELLELSETDEDKKETLSNIKVCAQSLLAHFNEILDYVQVESGDFPLLEKEFNIYNLLEETHAMMLPLANNKRLDFNFTIKRWPPRILIGDPLRTQRILTNILTNAIKFTEKGSVTVTVRWTLEDRKIGILEFDIEDTGIGIPHNKKEKIFERFHRLTPGYTGVYPGKGLGLNIVKQFLQDMGGSCEVESEPKNGTHFKIRIPYQFSTKDEITA